MTRRRLDETPITLAIDAMGGYNAPMELVAAVARASMQELHQKPVYFSLVGREAELTELLSECSHNPERINIVHAPTHVGLEESPRAALEERDGASIDAACKLVADGYAEAVISAGNPGAAVLSAKRHVDLLEGVERGALAAVYPTPFRRGDEEDPFSLILDVGASLEATTEQLVSFAVLGSAYARIVSGNETPRVALLSTSKQPRSGPRHVARAWEVLRARDDLNFVGNIEGHDIPGGQADVIVCEGYVGDVALKILEGVGDAAIELAKAAYKEDFIYRQGLRLLSGGLRKLKRLIDFEEYGGAPLLGFEQLMILADPRSGATAIDNALRLAIKNVRADLTGALSRAMWAAPSPWALGEEE